MARIETYTMNPITGEQELTNVEITEQSIGKS